jgi:hypothetical protein
LPEDRGQSLALNQIVLYYHYRSSICHSGTSSDRHEKPRSAEIFPEAMSAALDPPRDEEGDKRLAGGVKENPESEQGCAYSSLSSLERGGRGFFVAPTHDLL